MVGRCVLVLVLLGCGGRTVENKSAVAEVPKPVPDASTIAHVPEPPPDAAVSVKPIDQLPPSMRATAPTHSIEPGTTELLAYVAVRLTAPGSIVARMASADAIVVGVVSRSDVLDHKPSKAFLADPKLRGRAEDGPGGLVFFVNLVEMRVESWLRGPKNGDVVKAVWEAPQVDDGSSPALPLVDERGMMMLQKLPKSTLGKELAAAAPGAYAAFGDPVVLPDKTDAPATAVAGKLDASGPALQVALGALLKSKPKDAKTILAARIAAGKDDVDTLLVRAALFRFGDRAGATAGLDAMTMDANTLKAIGIVVLAKKGIRLGLSGPEPTTTLP